MDKIKVHGGKVLSGRVATSGAKNSALPILFASLLAEGEHIFTNVPHLRDIESTRNLLQLLGCETYWDEALGANHLKVRVPHLKQRVADYDVVRKMRASILCLGPLLAKYGEAVVSLPGGCAIGTRPINYHLEGLKSLGAEITLESGYVKAKTDGLKGASILLDMASVGATENIMMAASLAEGTTIIENAAKEPEIVDLANYINKMGGHIEGAGTSIISIKGVSSLKPKSHQIIPDRIEAGTLLLAGAITGGDIEVNNCQPLHLESLVSKLREVGFRLDLDQNSIKLFSPSEWWGTDLRTAPHPGFPTDLQAQFMALMTQAKGTSVISENIFENRFMHVNELMRMGADITPKTRVAIVRGNKGGLHGAPVMATDLRASASLVLAGLVAKGETVVNRIYHLDRGYEKLEKKLESLGAQILRFS